MRQLLIVTSSNRAMETCTRDAIAACERMGASVINQRGSADVTFARNAALSSACEGIRAVAAARPELPIDVVLMLDDDIDFTPEQVLELVNEVRARNHACSGVYITVNEVPAASPLKKDGKGRQLWQVGLGFVAFPAATLLELERTAVPYKSASRHGHELKWHHYSEFTWSGVRSGLWRSEDFTLCEKLGGVYLLPIDIGHRKTVSLRPNEDTLSQLREADRGGR